MTIAYFKKQVYGKDTLYVKDLEQSQIITKLTGKKTIDSNDMANLSKLGVTFVQVLN